MKAEVDIRTENEAKKIADCSKKIEQLEHKGISDRFATYFVRFATVVLILMLVNLEYKPHNSVAIITYVLAMGVFYYRHGIVPKVDIPRRMLYSFGIFFVALFICAFFTANIRCNLVGAFKQIYVTFPFFMLLTLYSLVDVRREIKYSLAIVAILQFLHIGYDFVVNKVPRPEGLFWNPNISAEMCGLMLPFFVYQIVTTKDYKGQCFWSFITLADFLAICMTKCRGELIAVGIVFVSVSLWFIYRYGREYTLFGIAGALVICMVGYCLFNRRVDGDMGRVYVYKSAFNMWKDNLLFGVGFGDWSRIYNSVYRLDTETQGLVHAHNIYLTLLSTTGIVGTVAFLNIFLNFLITLKKKVSQTNMYYLVGIAGAMSFLLHSLVDSTYSLSFAAQFIWLMFAVYLVDFDYENGYVSPFSWK